MNDKDFQALIAELGDLSAVQRDALIESLKSKLPINDAVSLIDSTFKANPVCGHCRSIDVRGWASQSGLKRYRCKTCAKTFNALTGTPLANLHKREAWFAYAQALTDGLSLRKAAKRCGIALDTSFRWRHRFLASAKNNKAQIVKGIVEADETFIRKSAKGSRRLAGRSPRKRGTPAKAGLSSDDYAPVLIVRDRHGATTDTVLVDLEGRTFAQALKPIVARDAVLVSDGRAAYGQFAEAEKVLHIALNASKGERVYEGFHIQNVNAYMSRLRGWMTRFNGVATKYLASYLGWRRMIEREGENLSSRRCLMQALAQAAT